MSKLMQDHLVCLSFDFDAVSLWMALGQTSPTPISRGEFGRVGVERILKLLQKHRISGTFFIPGITLKTYPTACRDIAEAGHEIAHHGFVSTEISVLSQKRVGRSLVAAATQYVSGTQRSRYQTSTPSNNSDDSANQMTGT